MSAIVLNTVVFLGSARSGGRLCDRVTTWVKSILALWSSSLGNDTVTHAVKVIDLIDVFGPGGALSHSGAELRLPTHFGPDSALGPKTLELRAMINAADCYLIISPEYNHTIPPALSSLMGHFGGSSYMCNPGTYDVSNCQFIIAFMYYCPRQGPSHHIITHNIW